jgi:AcrR family transcriptional regulator
MSRPRETTDEQILCEARACFLEHGPGVSTSVIAGRLGISHAVLFQRFGSKEGLMRAALLPTTEPAWITRAKAGPDAREGRAQLVELAEEIYAFFETIVPCVAVMRAAGVPLEAKRPEELPPVRARRELAAWFDRAAKRGLIRASKPELAADLLLGALHFRPFHQHVSQKDFSRTNNREYLEFAIGAVWRALAPEEGPGDPSARAPRRGKG